MAAFSAYGRMASPISATYNSQLNRSALGIGPNGLGVRQDRSAMTTPYKGTPRQGLYVNGPQQGGAMNMNQWEPQRPAQPVQGGAMNMGQWQPQRPPGWGMQQPGQYRALPVQQPGQPVGFPQNYLNQQVFVRPQPQRYPAQRV